MIQTDLWMSAFNLLHVPEGTIFPMLEQISLWGFEADTIKLSLASEQAPQIKSVVLPSATLNAWSLPWSQLGYLHILDRRENPDYFVHIMDVLSQCSQLRELRIHIPYTLDGYAGTLTPLPPGYHLTLHSLVSLSIATSVDVIYNVFTAAIYAPALEDLYVEGFTSNLTFESIFTFLGRHSLTIKEFDLGTRWPFRHGSRYVRLWTKLPKMSFLWLRQNMRTSEILHSLSVPINGMHAGAHTSIEGLSMDITPDVLLRSGSFEDLVHSLSTLVTKDIQSYTPSPPCAQLKKIYFRILWDDRDAHRLRSYIGRERPHIELQLRLRDALQHMVDNGIELHFDFIDRGGALRVTG